MYQKVSSERRLNGHDFRSSAIKGGSAIRSNTSCRRPFIEAPFIAILLILGVALRLPFLFNGVWRDEGYTYFDISAPTLHEMLSHIIVSETNPPLFFLLLRFWANLLGFGEIALKTFPLLWSVGSLLVTYLLARACSSRITALTALLLASTSYMAINFSTEVRPYSMEQFLATTCIVLYMQAIFDGNVRSFALWVPCSSMLLFTQYTGILLIATLLIATAIFNKAVVISYKRLIIGYALIAISFVFWVPIFIEHIQVAGPWIQKPSFFNRPYIFCAEMSYFMPVSAFFSKPLAWFLNSAVFVPAFLIGSLSIVIGYRAASRRGEVPPSSLAFLFCILLVVSLMMTATGYPLIRYFVPFTSLLAVCFAAAFVRVISMLRRRLKSMRGKKVLNFSVGVLAFIVLTVSMAESKKVSGYPKSGFRELAARTFSLANDDRVLWIVSPDYSASALGYYFRNVRSFQFRLHGFARWEHPEIFQIPDYAALWRNPAVLESTLLRINSVACTNFHNLAFVKPFLLNERSYDRAEMLYGKSQELEDFLRERYPVLQEQSYRGREENASLMLFRLRCATLP